jgi:hypothetical protein
MARAKLIFQADVDTTDARAKLPELDLEFRDVDLGFAAHLRRELGFFYSRADPFNRSAGG